MPILNYTTQVNVENTLSSIQKMLASCGARRILIDYDDNQNPISVSFSLALRQRNIFFKLPANWQKTKAVLENQKVAQRYKTEEHARKVTWRIIKDWLEAQMALVQTEQADLPTIMLPYIITVDDKLLAEKILNEPINSLKLLKE